MKLGHTKGVVAPAVPTLVGLRTASAWGDAALAVPTLVGLMTASAWDVVGLAGHAVPMRATVRNAGWPG